MDEEKGYFIEICPYCFKDLDSILYIICPCCGGLIQLFNDEE